MFGNSDAMIVNRLTKISQNIDTSKQEILNNLQSGSTSDLFVVNAMLSDDESLNEWAFRQPNIGAIINTAFELNSTALSGCTTVQQIAANTTAVTAISKNKYAMKVCAKNITLAPKFISYMSDEMALKLGYGYLKYNVGAMVTVNWCGMPLQFRVVHKNYLTSNKIVLLSENIIISIPWNSASTNEYTTSTIRTYLNDNVLKGFADEIQNAIIAPPLPCHNGATAVTCNDKIWIPSTIEMGYGTKNYAPDEGTVFDYYKNLGQSLKVKSINNIPTAWWLRTPFSSSSDRPWYVNTDGSLTISNGVASRYGVAFAFEI